MVGPSFKITDGKGFHVTFPNKWSVSVQFGGANYCGNYHDAVRREAMIESGDRGCMDAELAMLDPKGNLFRFSDGDTVATTQSPMDLLVLMNKAAFMGVKESDHMQSED